MPGEKVNFHVSINGKFNQDQIRWYKFYSSQGPQYSSYRSLLHAKPGLEILNLTLNIYNIREDDFYPNMFWTEMDPKEMPDKMVKVEPYHFTGFEMLNPSKLRYFFILERMPIAVWKKIWPELCGDVQPEQPIEEIVDLLSTSGLGDADTRDIEVLVQVSGESLTNEDFGQLAQQWFVVPKSIFRAYQTCQDFGLTLCQYKNEEFGYIRAVIYDFNPLIPGRTMVEQRLFLVQKDITKDCNVERSEQNCRCNPGFIGNGIHCVDIDECSEGMPLKCLPEATCLNTYGSYKCQCPPGYEGDGLYTCIDIDECVMKLNNCHIKATCVNNLGSYVCICKSGFVGNGKTCVSRSEWTPWSPWSICSLSCGFEQQMRIRICTHPESGMRCIGPSTDLRTCPVKQACSVDGQWSEWSPWSICSNPCSGAKKRVRVCNNPKPSNNGKPCSGPIEEVGTCYEDNCKVDGMWSAWTSWTPCPVSCGLSTVRRFRHCNNPTPMNGGNKCVGYGKEQGSCGFPVSNG
ncbi:uncharacterized protein O3C94_014475 [Discoglossus pictus]